MRLLVDILATYRITKLVLEDELLSDLRDKWFERFPPDSTNLGYLITCPWCTSVWAGFAVFTLRHIAPSSLTDIINGSLAASAVTGLAYERL